MTRKGSASFSPLNLLQGLLGGLCAGMAWKEGEYQLVFGILVYIVLTAVQRDRAMHEALEEVESRLREDKLVVVNSRDLKRFGLKAVDGELERESEE